MNSKAVSTFSSSLLNDFKNKEACKVKAIYFFLLSGMVMIWTQLTIHQKGLMLTERDISDFVFISSILVIVVPFLSGILADKIGNFSRLLAGLMLLLGANTFIFMIIPPIKIENNECLTPSLKMKPENITVTDMSDRRSNEESDVYALLHSDTGCVNQTDIILRNSESHMLTYWIYLVTRTSLMGLSAASYTLFDGCVMTLSKENGIDYGQQRAWGTIAALISAFLGGYLVDVSSEGSENKNFKLMFGISGASTLMAGMLMLSVNLSMKLPADKLRKSVVRDLRNAEAILLLCLMLFKGFFMGYFETFMYIFMSELGASQTLIGLTVTVGASAGIFLQIFATPICRLFGKPAVLCIGILCYSIRSLGFSFAMTPEFILGLEVLDAWGSGLTETASSMYCADLCSQSTLATFRGLIGAVSGGVGNLLSSKIGIEVKEKYGTRSTWQIWAAVALVVSVLYALSIASVKVVRRRKLRKIDAISSNLKDTTSQLPQKTDEPVESGGGIDNRAFCNLNQEDGDHHDNVLGESK